MKLGELDSHLDEGHATLNPASPNPAPNYNLLSNPFHTFILPSLHIKDTQSLLELPYLLRDLRFRLLGDLSTGRDGGSAAEASPPWV